MDKEHQYYLAMREALSTGVLTDPDSGESRPVGPKDKRKISSAVIRYESVNPGASEGVVPRGADDASPDPMAGARADQSDPAGLSSPLPKFHANVKAKDAANAAFGGNQGVRADYRDKTKADFQKQYNRVPSPVELERYQAEEWNKFASDAEARGAEAVRIPDSFSDTNLPPDASLGEKAKEKFLTGLDTSVAAAHGAISGRIPGAGKLIAYAVGGPDSVKDVDELVARHPEAAVLGGFSGGATGVASKVAGGVSGALAKLAGRIPVKSGLAKAAGRTIGAGLGGAAAGATQALGENAAANLTGSDQHIDVGDAALLGGAVGTGANVLGEGARAAAGAIERGKFGPGLKAGEELGGRPTLTGYKIAPGSPLAEAEQARVAGRLGSTADVAAERLAPKYASAGKNITERVNTQAANESAAMREAQVEPAPVPPPQEVNYSEVPKILPRPSAPDPLPPALSTEHAEAVRRFTFGYDSTVRRLQAGESPDKIAASLQPREFAGVSVSGAEHVAEAQGVRQALEDALRQHATELPTVYRGIGLEHDKAKSIVSGHSVDFSGKSTSTSFDPQVARSFAERNAPGYSDIDPNQVVFKLKKAQGLPAGEYADPVVKAEREAIETGGKYKITNRYKVTDKPDANFKREPMYVVEGERVGADYKDPTVARRVSLEPVLKAAAEELQGPNVLPDGPLRNIVRAVSQHPEVSMEEWERLVSQVDQLANLNKSKGVVDPRLARISAALRESAEGFPGLNEMRAGQAERFQKNELTMKHGGLPIRNKEVPDWQNMTADEQKQLYGTLRNQTGDIHGQTHEPAASVPMVRRAMDEIASDAGLKAELDRIPKLEAIDQVRKAARPHGMNVRLNPGGASASAFGKALEFAEIRGYPTLKALGSVPPDSDIVGILTKSPKTMELLRRMRTGEDLGQGKLANRIGLRGGAIAGRIVSAKNEVTQEDLDNLKKLQAAAGGQESAP